MLDKIRALAQEHLKTAEEVDAFMEGFQATALSKEAGLGATIMRDINNGGYIPKAAVGLGASLLGAGIVKGISMASNGVKDHNLRSRFEMALQQVKANNRALRGVPPAKVDNYAETIYKFGPHVASDPNLLGYLLGNAVQGESIDINSIKMIVDLEGRYVDNNKTSPLVGIKV